MRHAEVLQVRYSSPRSESLVVVLRARAREARSMAPSDISKMTVPVLRKELEKLG